MKIAHLSDIHFFSGKTTLSHLWGRAMIGYLNAHLRRKRIFITDYLDLCLSSLIKDEIESVIISGDFTTTADPKEFALAKEFIQKLLDAEIQVYTLPGNHDTYTKKSFYEKTFYSELSLGRTFSKEGFFHKKITPEWDLILLDNTFLNTPLNANGLFPPSQKIALESLLQGLKNVIVANHFSLTDNGASHKLIHGQECRGILEKHPHNVLYLHGHTHKTEVVKMGGNLYAINSSQTTICYTYHEITLLKDDFSYKKVQYYE
jgi:3',5'-cyclic AMP phosphodiesterase CpdA